MPCSFVSSRRHVLWRGVLVCLSLQVACQDAESPEPGQDQDAAFAMSSSVDARIDADTSSDLSSEADLQDLSEERDATTKSDMPEDASPDMPEPDMTQGVRHTFLYVSGRSAQGAGFVSRFRRLDSTGLFGDEQPVMAQGGNLSYMALDADRALLHAVDEASTMLHTVALDRGTGLSTGTAGQVDARCHGVHAMLDENGEHLAMSCYNEGETSLLELDEAGNSWTWLDKVDSGGKSHQTMRSPDGRYMFVVSLQDQMLTRYAITNDELVPVEPARTAIPDQIGPRHMAFHPTLSRAYILGELKPVLVTATYTSEGTLEELEPTALDENAQSFETTGAAVRVHPSGRWVLSTQRSREAREGRIVVTALDDEGRPTGVTQHSSSLGQSPRDLVISPDGKLVAVSHHRGSNQVVLFGFDETTGALSEAQRLDVTGSPYSVLFFEVDQDPRP